MVTPRLVRRLAAVAVLLSVAACGEGNARVTIPIGATMRHAADSLEAAGVIGSSRVFSLYAKLKKRDRRIKAGTYIIDRGASWNEIIAALEAGKGIVFTVTIPEGWDLRAIVPAISRIMKVPEGALDSAARDSGLVRRLGIPTGSLEGYLFPETYLMPEGSAPIPIVRRLVSEFERRWKPEWNAQLEKLQMTRHQIITLASIIEKEARVATERPIISAVYHNRLKRGMLLQADPTVIYALGRKVSRVLYRDLEVKSPYNTYRNAGLPPGPIANPGLASLQAAANPAKSAFLYFVSKNDGSHVFSGSLAEHNRNVQEYQRNYFRRQREAAK